MWCIPYRSPSAWLPFADVFNRLVRVMKPLSQRALACLGALLFLAAGVGEGATVERVTLGYDALGRVDSVAFPGSAEFSLGWTAPSGRLAPITAATVTAPWGQLFEYGLTDGRIATLKAVGVPTVVVPKNSIRGSRRGEEGSGSRVVG